MNIRDINMDKVKETYAYNGKDWLTCGCGNKPKLKALIPENTQVIFIKKQGIIIGPSTNLEYNVLPHVNSLDIDSEDAKIWLAEGFARPQLTGYKGQLTRTGVVNGTTT